MPTSARAIVVGSGPMLASSTLTPSDFRASTSCRPNESLESRPRNAVGTSSRARALAVLKGPPPGTDRAVPSALRITSINASPHTTTIGGLVVVRAEVDLDQGAVMDHFLEVVALPRAGDVGEDLAALGLILDDPRRRRQVGSHFALEVEGQLGVRVEVGEPSAPPV